MYKVEIEESGVPNPREVFDESALKLKIRSLTLLVMALAERLYEFIEVTEKLSEMYPASDGEDLSYYERVEQYEIELIRHALALTKGNQAKAARLLKLNHTTLNMKIKKYRLGFGGLRP